MLMRIFDKITNFLESIVYKIFGLFGIKITTGYLTVVADGPKYIEVKTPFTPEQIWINLETPNGIPVCGANLDTFSYAIIPNGFVLYVKLSCDHRTINWIARG